MNHRYILPVPICWLLLCGLLRGDEPTAFKTANGSDAPVVFLWPQGAPGAKTTGGEEKVRIAETGDHVVSNVHRPSLAVYLPKSQAQGATGVLVIPGGGHRELWVDHEGYAVARWLSEHGIAAFVLKYRLGREEGSPYRVEVESLQDVQRALRLIRTHSADWRVDPRHVGVIGFSAGGELAALVAAHHDAGRVEAEDPVERQSCRPAFQGLVYPGNASSIQPTAGAPPAFLLCGADDAPRISEELPQVYLRFKHAHVPVELHIYTGIGHGFGIRPTNHNPSAHWPDRFREWLTAEGF